MAVFIKILLPILLFECLVILGMLFLAWKFSAVFCVLMSALFIFLGYINIWYYKDRGIGAAVFLILTGLGFLAWPFLERWLKK